MSGRSMLCVSNGVQPSSDAAPPLAPPMSAAPLVEGNPDGSPWFVAAVRLAWNCSKRLGVVTMASWFIVPILTRPSIPLPGPPPIPAAPGPVLSTGLPLAVDCVLELLACVFDMDMDVASRNLKSTPEVWV